MADPFSLVRALVWTAAALRAYHPAPILEVSPELAAAKYANRFLEVWLLQWGPSMAPDQYQAVINELHKSMPAEDRVSPGAARRGPTCPECGRS